MDDSNGPQSGLGRGSREFLPLASSEKPARSDAVRNRARIIAAASDLFAEAGVDGLTMDALARRAGVGKGTLYRNFRDKSGISSALLDDRVRAMHAAMLQGPPPLGPGAPGPERLAAFAEAYVRHVATHLDLMLLTEATTPGGRFGREVYPFWRWHVEILVAETHPEQPRFRAEAIMAVLSAAQIDHWLRNEGHDLESLISSVQSIVADLARA